MKVRVRLIVEMTIRGEVHTPGTIIRVPVSVLSNLEGKVEIVDPLPEPARVADSPRW